MTMMIMREKLAKEASTFASTCLETICFLFYHNADHDHDHNDDDDDDLDGNDNYGVDGDGENRL